MFFMKEVKNRKLRIYHLFWLFFIGCFAGVIIEMFWWFLKTGVLESRRGLIYGPFNLVYGLGALLITVLLYRFRNKSSFIIFVLGFLIGAIFEYTCSLFQEIAFQTVSWDYGTSFLSINGRINLFFSIMWGILSVVWMKLFPYFLYFIDRFWRKNMKILTFLLAVFMFFNICISFLACQRQRKRYYGVEAQNNLDRFLDHHYPDERLNKIYANKKYVKKKSK